MHRLTALLMCLVLALSLGPGAVAHAAEAGGCIEPATELTLDHSARDSDQVPADAEKDYPHHHGGCHGHHVGMPIESHSAQRSADRRVRPLGGTHERMAGATTDPALRPPQS